MSETKKENMPTVDSQYQRLIEARNFHYDNLNKWLMSFYAIIAALFVAFYSVKGDDYRILVAVLGYIVSIAAFLSGKGYYYWEINWIMLVHHFEKTYLKELINEHGDDMRVYSVFANKKANNDLCSLTKGANISTTKVALAITGFIMCLWGMIVVYMGIKMLPIEGNEGISCCKLIFSGIASLVFTYIFVVVGGHFLKSDLDNIEDLGLTKENIDKPLKTKK